MIGVNDIASEVFILADTPALVNFALRDSNIMRLSMWSVTRVVAPEFRNLLPLSNSMARA
ncbi:hypothetical protein [Reyranella sp.]|uniref:hypothetical protein n=1 Tax=Reyranella sp. TaxID=1929291 RepID=UPI003D13E757